MAFTNMYCTFIGTITESMITNISIKDQISGAKNLQIISSSISGFASIMACLIAGFYTY